MTILHMVVTRGVWGCQDCLVLRKTTCPERNCGFRRSSQLSGAKTPAGYPTTPRCDRVRPQDHGWPCVTQRLFFSHYLEVPRVWPIPSMASQKSWSSSHGVCFQVPLATQVEQSIQRSLQNLGTSYLDSLVMHSPMPTLEENLEVGICGFSWQRC